MGVKSPASVRMCIEIDVTAIEGLGAAEWCCRIWNDNTSVGCQPAKRRLLEIYKETCIQINAMYNKQACTYTLSLNYKDTHLPTQK